MARHLPLLLLAFALGGCGFLFKSPDKANIRLRKQNQELEGQLASLRREVEAKDAQVKGLAERTGTVPSLDPARLDKLFTVHGIQLQRLTGGADLDLSRPGQEGMKVYVRLIDQTGDEIKSSGSFVVDAFDLADPAAPRVGHWEFPSEQSRANWHSFLTRYEYVLPCPWQQPPRHPEVTVRVTFTDDLSGRVFNAQQVAKVEVPATTRPAPEQADLRSGR